MSWRYILTAVAVTFTLSASRLSAAITLTVTDFEAGILYAGPIGTEEAPCSADNFSRQIDWGDGAGFQPYMSDAKAVDCSQNIFCVRPGKYNVLNQMYPSGQPHIYMNPGRFNAQATLTIHCIGATGTQVVPTSAAVYVFERHPINQIVATSSARRGETLTGQIILSSEAEGSGTTVDLSVDKQGVFGQFQSGNTLRLYRIVPSGKHEGDFSLTVQPTAALGPVTLTAKTIGKEQQVVITIIP